MVVETALEVEMTKHVGYETHEAAARNGGNSRNGARPKTVTADVGPVQVDVPRDRDGSFEPKMVRTPAGRAWPGRAARASPATLRSRAFRGSCAASSVIPPPAC